MAGLKKRGFTLIELLTVVAIIGLLIGILVPSVNMAMRRAKSTAVRAQLDGITKGLEIFKADFGDYPSSSTADWLAAGDERIQGSHRLVFALLGADQLGCPTANPDNYSATYYTDASGNAVAEASWGLTGTTKTSRRGPYVDPTGFNMANDNSTSSATSTYVWLLCDKFDKRQNQPTAAPYAGRNIILYYKAANNGDQAEKIYNPHDNFKITTGDVANNPADQGADNDSLAVAGSKWNTFMWGQLGSATNVKPGGIVNSQATVGNIYQPYKKESYLLISAGYDGIFFNDDDVNNWK